MAGDTTAHLVEQSRAMEGSLDERQAAFTRLVRRSQRFVFALALSLLRDVEDAKDVSQDAFANAWRRLDQLRDPAAFEPWLKAIVVRQCARHRRQRTPVSADLSLLARPEDESDCLDYLELVAAAVRGLPPGERRVTILFYFGGYTQKQIARRLRLTPSAVGKRLYSARLRIRRLLPPTVRSDFVKHTPSPEFVARVHRGLLDEYVGHYRFEARPAHVVAIRREGDSLIGDSGGQRHMLVAAGESSLVTANYDGEGRFRRNRQGQVTDFVYYEFGQRMGVARRIGDP
jgi:RNA polymerase sigma-70 factor (ECF subfamily)